MRVVQPRRMHWSFAALIAVVGILMSATLATYADAATRRKACYDGSSANSILVRNNLTEKRAIAILFTGETFDIYDSRRQSNGALWYYGFAYGGENKWGWVYQTWITDSNGRCPNGSAP